MFSDVGLLDADLRQIGAGEAQSGLRDLHLLVGGVGGLPGGGELGQRLRDIGARGRHLGMRLRRLRAGGV